MVSAGQNKSGFWTAEKFRDLETLSLILLAPSRPVSRTCTCIVTSLTSTGACLHLVLPIMACKRKSKFASMAGGQRALRGAFNDHW
jgi:hypothetical protein